MLHESILSAIGNTPLVRLGNISSGNVFCKAEFMNPGGSIKDRIARYIIESAEKDGSLRPGMTIIEATSGNTGIGLSMVGMLKGYQVICVMPENMSEERKKIIQAFGGEILTSPAKDSLNGALSRLGEIMEPDPEKYFVVNQFSNPYNSEIHHRQTARELWEDMEGRIDVFTAGIGSGGTLQGIGQFLKEKDPAIEIVAVEPKNSAALLGMEPGLHQIQGIGDGFIPELLDTSLIDKVVTVSDEEAIGITRRLSREEGLLVGTSSGANVFAALDFDDGRNRVATILADRAERYFSTALL